MRILSIRNGSIPILKKGRKTCQVSTSDASTQRVHLTKHFSCNPYAFFLSTFVCLLSYKTLWKSPPKGLIDSLDKIIIYTQLSSVPISQISLLLFTQTGILFFILTVGKWITESAPATHLHTAQENSKGYFHWMMLKTSCH